VLSVLFQVPVATVPTVVSELVTTAAARVVPLISAAAFIVTDASGSVIVRVPEVDAPVIRKLFVPGVPLEPAK